MFLLYPHNIYMNTSNTFSTFILESRGGEREGRKQEGRKNGSRKGRGGEGGRANLMSGRRVKVKRIV